MPNDITILVCGQNNTDGIAKNALDQLSRSVNLFSEKSMKFLNGEGGDDIVNFGPFCSRAFLENSFAALVGRIDCFRMLYLSEFQSNGQYELGKRAKSAFAWTGDVFPVEEKVTSSIWSMDHDVSKINRALFSRHMEHIYWKPAILKMVDYISPRISEPIFSDLLSVDPDNYISRVKGECAQAYSLLSKGVHWEFFSSTLTLDEDTVRDNIRSVFLMVAILALASHFIPTAYASLAVENAAEAYAAFRRVMA